MPSRRIKYAAQIGTLLLILLLVASITPVGPWAVQKLLVSLAPSFQWQIAIEEATGSFLGRMTFHQVRGASEDGTLDFEVERLQVSLWSYAVDLVRPRVNIRLGFETGPSPAETDSGAIHLPVTLIPEIQIIEGSCRILSADSSEVALDELEARYQLVADSLGQLALETVRLSIFYQQEELAGTLRGLLRLAPHRLSLEELEMDLHRDGWTLEMQAAGQLHLEEPLPGKIEVNSRIRSAQDSLLAGLNIQMEGTLEPLDWRIRVEGQGQQAAWGKSKLSVWSTLGSEQARIDSLVFTGLDGNLQGRGVYHIEGNKLEGRLNWTGVQLKQIPGSTVSGQVDGQLVAASDLEAGQHTVDLELQARHLDILPGEPLDIRLQAAYRPDSTARAELRTGIGFLLVEGWATPDGNCDLDLAGSFDLNRFMASPVAPVQLEGKVRPDSVGVDLKLARFTVGQESVGPLSLQMALREGRFFQATMRLEEDQVRLQVRGDAETGRVDTLVGLVKPLPLARFVPGLRGGVQGQVHASGELQWERSHLSARFALDSLAYQGWMLGDVDVRLAYLDRSASAWIDGPGFHLQSVLNEGKDFEARMVFEKATLHRFPEPVAVDSTADLADRLALSGQVRCAGNLDRLEALEAQVDLEQLDFDYQGWQARNHKPVRLRHRGGVTVVESLHLQTTLGRVAIKGSHWADSLDFEAQFDSLSPHLLVPDLVGQGQGQLRVQGTIQHPRIRGGLDLEKMALGGHPLGNLRTRLELEDSLKVAVDYVQDLPEKMALPVEGIPAGLTLTLTAPAAPLVEGLNEESTETFHLAFAVRQLDLERLLTYALEDSLQGYLDLEGWVRAPLALLADLQRWPALEGRLALHQLQLEKKKSLRMELLKEGLLQREEQQMTSKDLAFGLGIYDPIQKIFNPSGQLFLEGGKEAGEPSWLRLRLEEMRLAVFEQMALEEFDLPIGKARFQIQIEEIETEPRLTAVLGIDLAQLGAVEGHILASRQNGSMELKWRHRETPDSLQVQAQLPWDLQHGQVRWDQGQLKVSSTPLPLHPLLELVPELDNLDGTFQLDLDVQGFAETMGIQGQVDIAALKLALLDTQPAYLFPSGRLVFSGQRGEFQNFHGSALTGQGRIALEGYLEFDATNEAIYDVRLTTADLPYRYDDVFSVRGIQTDLRLRSTISGSFLEGTVRLDSSLAEPTLLTALNAPPVPPPPAVQSDFMERLELDVFVELPGLKVTNEIMDIDLDGGSNINGTFYKPLFQGGMEITAGKVGAFGRQFTFQTGRITLDQLVSAASVLDLAYDPLLLNPYLDIVATTEMFDKNTGSVFAGPQRRTITLRLEGALRSLVPRFESEGMEESEVLALLAFGSGKDPAEETGGVYDAAKGALYGAAGGWLLTEHMSQIGLDEFLLLPSGTVQGTIGQTTLRLGKLFRWYLPVWVRYEAAADNPSTGEFSTEIGITRYLALTGLAQSTYDRYGLGFGLNKDF